MPKFESVLQAIGNTPHVRLNNLFGDRHKVYMKLERANPGGSIKDRIALAMIEDAISKGELKPGMTVVEPTSGNTGIGLALTCAVKKIPLIIVMPESMSIERRRIMVAYGAKLVLTPREKGMPGAVAHAKKMVDENPEKYFLPQQFENPANVDVHTRTTAQEIIRDFPEGIDAMITGVGTGGHITGCAKVLKEKFPAMKVYAVEPELSPVLSGGKPAPHPIQGIGAGFVPAVCDTSLFDGIIQASKDEAFEMAVKSCREEGIFIGISSGASLAAIRKKLPDLPEGATVLTFCYDTGERYLSVDGLFKLSDDDVTFAVPPAAGSTSS